MPNARSRPDVELMQEMSRALSDAHSQVRDWSGSDFNWMLTLSTGARGAVGRQLVEAWVGSLGIPTGRVSENNAHYVLAWDLRIQVKTSTMWESGHFRFQQIRDQNFDLLLCLGLQPDDVSVWLFPKDVVLEHLSGVGGQHTGASARETYWMNLAPGANNSWVDEYGDQFSTAKDFLSDLSGR
jgi:hypothetical protein